MSPWHLLQRSQHRKCFLLLNCQVLNFSCHGTAISSEHSSNHSFSIGFLDSRVRKSKFSARKRNGQPFCYHQDFLRSSELLWCHGGPETDLSHNREVKFLSLPSLHSTVSVVQKYGVCFWLRTGKKRVDKKHSSKAVPYRSCWWVSFWKGNSYLMIQFPKVVWGEDSWNAHFLIGYVSL